MAAPPSDRIGLIHIAVAAAVATFTWACGDSVKPGDTGGPQCLPEDPFERGPSAELLICGLESDEWPAAENGIDPRVARACVPPDADGGCQSLACDADEVDRLLRERVAEKCTDDVVISKIQAQCWAGPTPPNTLVEGSCCVRGFYWAEATACDP